MVIKHGEIWWATLPEPSGSGPGLRRPVLVIQANEFNKSLINTIIVAVITSNIHLAHAPGNVFLSRRDSGLSKESVVNISQLLTIDKRVLTERVSTLSFQVMTIVKQGLKLVLALQ